MNQAVPKNAFIPETALFVIDLLESYEIVRLEKKVRQEMRQDENRINSHATCSSLNTSIRKIRFFSASRIKW